MAQQITWQQASAEDFPKIASWVKETTAREEYFTLSANASDADLKEYWFGGKKNETFFAMDGEEVLGMFYLRANHYELGEHVANAGFIVSPHAQKKGLGRVLGEKALARAKERGFRGMQFNFVVSTNVVAVKLWKSLGFQIIGVIPKGYYQQHERYVDAYVMFKDLTHAE